MNLNQYSQASAQPGLAVEKIANLYIPYPPNKAQIKIIQHIEQETSQIDSAIEKIEQEIILIEEYRTSLIYQAVTGKIRIS